jgi:hypothetical protein
MNPKTQTFIGIMIFYMVLSYVIFPAGFYFLIEKSYAMAGTGFVVGSIVSIMLWLFVGKKLI